MANPSPPLPAQLKRWQQVSLTTWTVVAVVILGVLGAGVLRVHDLVARPDGTEKVVVVTKGSLPAFSELSGNDVQLKNLRRSAVPAGAMRSLNAVRGHYVLRKLGEGQVVVRTVVGPPAPSGHKVVIALPVDKATSAGIRAGAYVDVLLAPTGNGRAVIVLRRVLVIERQPTALGNIVFLAVPRKRELAIGAVAGRGKVILARVPDGQ